VSVKSVVTYAGAVTKWRGGYQGDFQLHRQLGGRIHSEARLWESQAQTVGRENPKVHHPECLRSLIITGPNATARRLAERPHVITLC